MALLIWTLSGGASAGFSPGLEQLEAAYNRGQAMALDIRASLESWNALSADSLAAVQDALKQASLLVRSQESDGRGIGNVSLTLNAQPLYRVQESRDPGQRLLALLPQGMRYLSGPGQAPLDILLDTQAGVHWENLLQESTWQALHDVLPQVYALLEPFGKTVGISTSIKNVGTSRSRIEYALTREEWTALWPQMVSVISDALAPHLGLSFTRAMMSLRFDTEGTLKRFVDDDGMDMGWQFTGRLSLDDEDTRRVTLFGGYKADKGLYLSLKLPAVRGRNGLTLNISAKLNTAEGKRGLLADYALAGRSDDRTISAKGQIRLESANSPDGERISGSIRLDSLTVPGQTQRRRLTVKPALLFKDGRVSGALTITREQGNATQLALGLDVLLQAGEPIPPFSGAGAKDLRELTPDALEDEQDRFLRALLEPLRELLLQLPQRQRAQLLHDMGRVERTQGESVPPLPKAEPDSFVVSDISVEEDKP